MKDHPGVEMLLSSPRPLREKIASHALYGSFETLEEVHLFMEHHIFAVWDFMSLVKSLQNTLTCTSVPWLPYGDPITRRMINEITLDEESDESGKGDYISHFELYLEAMEQSGANTSPIHAFICSLQKGETMREQLR